MLVTTSSAVARQTKATARENTASRWRRRSLLPARQVRRRPLVFDPKAIDSLSLLRRNAHAAAGFVRPVITRGLVVDQLDFFVGRDVVEALRHVGGLAVVEHHDAARAHVEEG